MNVLVTGGAGFIGSHVCDALLARGDTVLCIDSFNNYYDPKIKENNIREAINSRNFKLYRADITDISQLAIPFTENKIDAVIHLAARAGVRASFKDPELYRKVNVDGTKNILELSVRHKVGTFIFGSSSSVYGLSNSIPFKETDTLKNIISPYAETKKQAEILCKEFHNRHKINVTILRFFTVYGPRGRPDMAPYKFTKNILENKPIGRNGDGKVKRDFTYIKDIVHGIISSLDKRLDFEIINLGNSEAVELNELINAIEDLTGKKAVINQLPPEKGDVPLTCADITKAKFLLGYSPKTKLREGMRLFVEWFKNGQ